MFGEIATFTLSRTTSLSVITTRTAKKQKHGKPPRKVRSKSCTSLNRRANGGNHKKFPKSKKKVSERGCKLEKKSTRHHRSKKCDLP